MSSTHEGVSCDGCMAPNFAGDRYKCLRCYDFDLCARCYAEERAEGRSEARALRESGDEHLPTHPMQCIMTQQDFKLTYQGDQSHSWDKLRVVIFTCPVCGAQGMSRERLVCHVIDEHSAPPRSPSSQRFEMACPICISTDFYRVGFGDYMPNQLTDMVAHMQEHHVQPPPSSSNSNATSRSGEINVRGGGLSDFLRDRELRRVIMHSVPLIGRDSDFDDAAPDGLQRGNISTSTAHRGDGFSRVRRRIAADRPADTSGTEERSSPQPPFGFRPLSSRQRTVATSQQVSSANQTGGEGSSNNPSADGLQRVRSLRQVELNSEVSRSGSTATQRSSTSRTTVLIPSSQRSVRSVASSGGNASFSRTFQSPIASFSRPSVPRTLPTGNTNARSSVANDISGRAAGRGGGVQGETGSAQAQLVSDATRVMVESQLHRGSAESAAHRAETTRQGTRATLRRERNVVDTEPTSGGVQSRRGRVDTRSSAQGTPGSDVLPPSWSRPARAGVRAGRPTVRQQPLGGSDATAHPLVTNSSGRPVLVLSPSSQPQVVCDELAQAGVEHRSQKASSEEKRNENDAVSVEVNGVIAGSNKARLTSQTAFCPLFTSSLQLAYPMPILKIEKAKAACISRPEKLKECARCVAESVKKDLSSGTVSLRLIMRVGRPLKSMHVPHGVVSVSQDGATNEGVDSHWWNRREASHYDSDLFLRHSRRSRQNAAQGQSTGLSSPLQAASRSSASRGESAAVPVSGALDVIRRLDARSARSHRPSPTQSDAAVATASPNNENGSPAASAVRQYYQVPASILSGSYFSGRDPSVVEAVARDVAAFSEACGFHLRHLHNLIRRSESAANNASSGGRSLSRHAALRRNEARPRGPGRARNARDGNDEELSEYFHAAFKAPEVDILLDGSVTPKRRSFKPFRVKSEEEAKRVFAPWLRKEESRDDSIVISNEFILATVNTLFAQIPEFVNDELVEDGTASEAIVDVADEPMFEAGKGSDDEMLEKKCQSSGLNRSASPHIVAGPVSAVPNEQTDSENDYWKDYRFLHNRRDVFLLKKSIDVPPENIFDASDWRFPRQLLLGALDVPASVYLRSHYLPHMFSRVLRSNLRESIQVKRDNEPARLKSDTEVMFEFDNGKDLQWQRQTEKGREGSSAARLHVHPLLWHLLDLAGFVEIRP